MHFDRASTAADYAYPPTMRSRSPRASDLADQPRWRRQCGSRFRSTNSRTMQVKEPLSHRTRRHLFRYAPHDRACAPVNHIRVRATLRLRRVVVCAATSPRGRAGTAPPSRPRGRLGTALPSIPRGRVGTALPSRPRGRVGTAPPTATVFRNRDRRQPARVHRTYVWPAIAHMK